MAPLLFKINPLSYFPNLSPPFSSLQKFIEIVLAFFCLTRLLVYIIFLSLSGNGKLKSRFFISDLAMKLDCPDEPFFFLSLNLQQGAKDEKRQLLMREEWASRIIRWILLHGFSPIPHLISVSQTQTSNLELETLRLGSLGSGGGGDF